MSIRDLFDDRAMRDDDDEDDGDYDSADDAPRRIRNADAGSGGEDDDDDDDEDPDSSDEDEEDDPEEARKLNEGFIDDDDEDMGEADVDAAAADRRRRRKKKRKSKKRKHRTEDGADGEAADTNGNSGRVHDDEELDEDDLDLVMEATGEGGRQRFKRLKQAGAAATQDLTNIFDEDGEGESDDEAAGAGERRAVGEMDDFIEDDLSEDEFDRAAKQQQRRKAAKAGRTATSVANTIGMDEDAYEQIYEVFGDGTEYQDALDAEADDLADNEAANRDLAEVFEPSELKARMATDTDEIIRITDEPERMQIWREAYRDRPLDDTDFDWLCSWMHVQLWAIFEKEKQEDSRLRAQQNSRLKELHRTAVRRVLEFYTRELVEVPYIRAHRREYLLCKDEAAQDIAEDRREDIELLPVDHLWRMVRLEVRFRSMLDRRDAAIKIFSSLSIEDDSFAGFISMDKLETLQDAADVQEYLHFRYSERIRDLQTVASGQRKRAGRYQVYEKLRKSDVYKVVLAYGITAAQFSININEGQKRHYPEDPEEMPLDVAKAYVADDALSPQTMLDRAREGFVEELLHDPAMRKAIRYVFANMGQLFIRPTEKGKKTIDDTHEYYAFKYADELSVLDLNNAPGMFLTICRAQEEELVTVDFKLREEAAIITQFALNMQSDGVSDVAEAWNKERHAVVQLMMDKFKPSMSRHVLETLRSECEDKIAELCRHSLYRRLDQRRPSGRNSGRVLAVSNGAGEQRKDATVLVVVDERGKVQHTTKVVSMRFDESRLKLRQLISDHQIGVVAVSGYSPDAARLLNDIETTAIDMSSSERPAVLMINDEVARVYQSSARAQSEYPQYSSLYRYCIALAHYVQSPLHEYVALERDSLMAIKFHPQQALITADKLWMALESAIVDMVNLVGVDINRAQESLYERNLLQYVSGLGPRKADRMLTRISHQGGYLRCRTDMASLKYATRNVFVNCASFLRIPFDRTSFTEATQEERKFMEILDETRVHPEDYELANKMAADAVEIDEEELSVLPGGPVLKMHEDNTTDKIQELILEEYAEELLRAFNQPKLWTLRLIARELEHPYAELRSDFRRLTPDQTFTMLTGESTNALDKGSIISATIRRVLQRGDIMARTSSGVEVEISSYDSGVPEGADVAAAFNVDQAIQIAILNLDKETFKVQGSLRPSDLEAARSRSLSAAIAARGQMKWGEFDEERDKSQAQAAQEARERQSRIIKHPLFRPFTARQAEEFLGGMQRGDVVIRPSGKGPDHIAVTWKVADGIFQHIDVLELDKDSTHSVGRVLRVGQQKYSDLDELVVSHVRAMSRKVDEISTHDKFQRGSRADTEQYLSKYSEANPRRSCYAFCFNRTHPGYFDLCFKANPRAPVGHWPIKVVPNAFMMRDNLYADMPQLCNGFKMMFAQGRS
ncbi:Transcription elongation factor spt6 [Savitreella phatthalungensis]